MKSAEIDLNSEEFEEHILFLTKVSVQKLNDGKFLIHYPKKQLKSYQQLWQYFHFLVWFWAMTTLMEREAEKESKTDKALDYAR